MKALQSVFDLDFIRDVSEVLKSSGINEIEISHGDSKLRIICDSRHKLNRVSDAAMLDSSSENTSAVSLIGADVADELQVRNINETNEDKSREIINAACILKSPMVGTAYRASEPDAPPFIEVGSKVRSGQTVMIIEAMKTMNQIQAHRDGIVSEIRFEDAVPVEFDQPLLVIT